MTENNNRSNIAAKGKFKKSSKLDNLINKDLLDRFCHNFDRIPQKDIEALLDKYNCL